MTVRSIPSGPGQGLGLVKGGRRERKEKGKTVKQLVVAINCDQLHGSTVSGRMGEKKAQERRGDGRCRRLVRIPSNETEMTGDG